MTVAIATPLPARSSERGLNFGHAPKGWSDLCDPAVSRAPVPPRWHEHASVLFDDALRGDARVYGDPTAVVEAWDATSVAPAFEPSGTAAQRHSGTAAFNVLIRSLETLDGDPSARLGLRSAIVAASVPDREGTECALKAGFLRTAARNAADGTEAVSHCSRGVDASKTAVRLCESAAQADGPTL